MTPVDEKCPLGVKNQERIVALEKSMNKVEDAVTEIRDKLLGRLPTWATVLMSVLMLLLGYLLKR